MPYENLTQELKEEVQNEVLTAIQTAFDNLSGNLVNLTTDDIAGTYKMNQNRQSLTSHRKRSRLRIPNSSQLVRTRSLASTSRSQFPI